MTGFAEVNDRPDLRNRVTRLAAHVGETRLVDTPRVCSIAPRDYTRSIVLLQHQIHRRMRHLYGVRNAGRRAGAPKSIMARYFLFLDLCDKANHYRDSILLLYTSVIMRLWPRTR